MLESVDVFSIHVKAFAKQLLKQHLEDHEKGEFDSDGKDEKIRKFKERNLALVDQNLKLISRLQIIRDAFSS